MSFPDPALFDRKATRSAVLRGLLRTGVLVLVLYLILQVLSQGAGYAVFDVRNGPATLERDGVQAFQVRHPSITIYRPTPAGQTPLYLTDSSGEWTFSWLRTTTNLDYLLPDGGIGHVKLRLDDLGRISEVGSYPTSLDTALLVAEPPGRKTPRSWQGSRLPPSATSCSSSRNPSPGLHAQTAEAPDRR